MLENVLQIIVVFLLIIPNNMEFLAGSLWFLVGFVGFLVGLLRLSLLENGPVL